MVFSLSALWWRRIRGLWKLPDGRDWLRGKLGLVLMGGAIFSKSLSNFLLKGRAVFPPCYLTWTNYGGGNEDNGDLLQKVPCKHCYTQCPQTCSRPLLKLASARDSWTRRKVWVSPLWGHCSFLLVHKVLFVPSQSQFPQSCVSSGSSMVG